MKELKEYLESRPDIQEVFVNESGEWLRHQTPTFKTKVTRADVLKAKADVAPTPKVEPKEHVITQEDLDNNPDLVEQGLNVGDVITIEEPPIEEPKKTNKKK